MAAYLDEANGVRFYVEVPGKNTNAVLAHSDYLDENGNVITNSYVGPIQAPTKFINACDIILNATYNDTTITSMADLVKKVIDMELSLQN